MADIQTVGIIGAGALGLLYLESIEKHLGDQAVFLAPEERCSSIRNKSFSINGERYGFNALCPLKKKVQLDLIIVAVKNYHIPEIIPLLQASAGTQTIVISVLNGISSEALLEEACPEANVLYAAALGMDAVKEGDTLNYTGRGKIIIGSRENKMTEALSRVSSFFKSCSIDFMIPDDIHRELWYKWMINIGVNQLSAVTGSPYKVFQTDPLLRQLMDKAMLETITVARAEGVDLREEDLERWYKILKTLGPEGKTSMLQDMEAGRKTEVDSFAGELIKRAAGLGIEVPVNETLFSIIKTKEKL